MKIISTLLEWEMEVLGNSQHSIVIFYSQISEPSVRMINILKEVEQAYLQAKFYSIDIDENAELTWRFRVSIVPTIMIFKGVQKLQEIITVKTKEELYSAISLL